MISLDALLLLLCELSSVAVDTIDRRSMKKAKPKDRADTTG
jgi:hypothetical protein